MFRTFANAVNDGFSCELCNKNLKSLKNLDQHRLLHNKIKRLKCDYCGSIHSNKTALSHHIDIHRKHSILQCNACQSSFTTVKIMKDHLKGHISPKICEFCGKSFARTFELNLHIASRHVNEMKFACSYCKRKFATFKAQREHETRIHRTEKSEVFECSQCQKSFSMREKLRVHSFEHYIGKVFNCLDQNCAKFFKSQSSLTLHKKSHSQEKNYRCNRCEKSFVQSSGLYKHLKRCNGAVKAAMIDPEETVRIAKAQYQELLNIKGRIVRNKSLLKALLDSQPPITFEFAGEKESEEIDGRYMKKSA